MSRNASPSKPWHVLRSSHIHGTGVYAARNIPAGTTIFEYVGEIISAKEADRRHPVNPDDPFHTFFFALGNSKVIDGGVGGNDAKWINHSCEPNCETEESDDYRVFIQALRDIKRGEELYYDYGLILDERLTKKVREQYLCLCGTEGCRGTMLALKRKPASAAKTTSKKSTNKKTAKAAKKSDAGLTGKSATKKGPVSKDTARKAGAKKRATEQVAKSAKKATAKKTLKQAGKAGKKAKAASKA